MPAPLGPLLVPQGVRTSTSCSGNGPCCRSTHLEPNPWPSQRLWTAKADGEEAWAATLRAVCAGCRPVYAHTYDRCSLGTGTLRKGSFCSGQDSIVFSKQNGNRTLWSCWPSLLLPWLRPEVSAQRWFCERAETVQSDGRGTVAGRAQDRRKGVGLLHEKACRRRQQSG